MAYDFCKNLEKPGMDENFIQVSNNRNLESSGLDGIARGQILETKNQLVVVGEEILNVEPLDLKERTEEFGENLCIFTPERSNAGEWESFLEGVTTRNEEFMSG